MKLPRWLEGVFLAHNKAVGWAREFNENYYENGVPPCGKYKELLRAVSFLRTREQLGNTP